MRISNRVPLFLSIILLMVSDVFGQECLIPNCVSCATNPYVCDDCPAGLACCQTQCLECVNQTQCTQCPYEYSLNQSTSICQLRDSCYQIACQNCTNEVCSSCLQGFVLDTQTYECVLCPTNCYKCTLNRTCLLCQLSYFLQGGQCQKCVVSNCYECAHAYTCILCQPGYYVNSPICMSCPSDCQYCTNRSNCLVCDAGYYLTSAQKCKPCALNCDNCSMSANNCTHCSSNSYLLEGECFPCYATIPFCVSCQMVANQFTCLNCAAFMFVSPDNTCQPCSLGCQNCSSSLACSSCQLYYFLTNTSSCQSCNMPNCLTCTNNQTCTSCIGSYYLTTTNEQCLPCSPSCSLCTSSTACKICSNGFYLANGYCLQCRPGCSKCARSSSNCISCGIGFYGVKFEGNRVCVPCPAYCINCLNQGTCIVCNPGYYHVNASTCLQCPVNNCYNCNNTDTNGYQICSLCFNGYYLSLADGSCQPCQSDCQICSNATLCQLCLSGFFLTPNGKCAQCLTNCSVCTSLQSCIECSDGFYLANNQTQCLSCPIGCAECYASNICRSCNSGYYLNSSSSSLPICFKCPSPCLSCSDSHTCTLCEPKYTLQLPGICVQCPPNFLVCTKSDGLQCDEGFALYYENDNISCKQCPSNCQKCVQTINATTNSSSIKCLKCNFGSTLLQNGICFTCGSTNQTVGCQTCDNLGQCQTCFMGFSINSSKQCYSNMSESPSNWPQIIASICLGCVAMVLIIILVYQRVSKPMRPSSFRMQLTEEQR